jgi:serine/threonine protein kinase
VSTASKRQPIPFGNYLLLDRINIGGMAEVWRAKTFGAGGFERVVAIKRILPNIAEDEEFISMFIDEAKITVQLNHANIGQIYELSHVANSYFIAMEYLSGRDMRSIFDRARKRGEPTPIPLVCYVMAKCCEGLDYAHRKKDSAGRDLHIVHRDVSPQNLLVSFEGEVKVIDFGIAKAAGKATKTQAGILKGKFGYMSPEQIRGLPLDRRSDVFGIGICLYEMLTGERAFQGESDFSVLEKVRKVDLLPPSTYNRKIPDALERIVMKALARDVADRYSYASEVADELQRFVVTPDNVFGRKDLAQFMHSAFAEDLEKEKQRLHDYAEVTSMPTRGASPTVELELPASALNGSSTSSLPPPVPSVPLFGHGGPSGPTRVPRLTATSPLLRYPADDGRTVLVDGVDALARPTAPTPPPTSASSEPARPAAPLNPFADEETTSYAPGELAATPREGSRLPAGASLTARPRPPMSVSGRVAVPLPELTGTTSSPTRSSATATSPSERKPPARTRTMTLDGPLGDTETVSLPDLVRRNPVVWLSGAGGALLALILISWLAASSPTGLLFVDLPPEVAKVARVNINGEELKVTVWPLLRKEPAGKVTVMIVADGYETLLETVEVKAGNDYTQLKSKLVKKP